jgi:hypothetical protein
MIGIGVPASDPSMECRQLWHTPLVTICTMTCPGPGGSTVTSSMAIGTPTARSTGALTDDR